MKKYIIIGAGAYLNVIFDNIHANNGKVIKLYKNMPEAQRDRVPTFKEQLSVLKYDIDVYDSLDSFKPENDYEYIIGCVLIKKYKLINELKRKYSLKISQLIHPHAQIGSNVHIGEGVIIGMGVVISSNIYLDDFCVIKRSSSLGHDSKIGKYSHISPAVALAGLVHIGDYSSIGIGCTVIDRIHIGNNSIIGAGAVVTKDVSDNVIAYGVPAKVIRENKDY